MVCEFCCSRAVTIKFTHRGAFLSQEHSPVLAQRNTQPVPHSPATDVSPRLPPYSFQTKATKLNVWVVAEPTLRMNLLQRAGEISEEQCLGKEKTNEFICQILPSRYHNKVSFTSRLSVHFLDSFLFQSPPRKDSC